jgi:carboxyl-terminal processing protease
MRAIAAAVAAAAALALGMYLGGHPTGLPEPLRDVFVDESASVQAEATDVIEGNYYRKVSDERLRNASLRGMVRSLGSRFSYYFTPRQNELFRQATSGEFSGVGMTVVERKRGLLVVGVFDDSPAKERGIRPGEVITEVNGRSIAGDPSDVATAKITGKEGSIVKLTVKPPGKPAREIRVRRERIRVPAVSSKLRRAGGRRVGVLRLTSFTSGAHGELVREIGRERRGAEAFVLDMRGGNGGGLLDEAVLVSTPSCRTGRSSRPRAKRAKRVFEATGDTATRKPVVVLVDRGTASASEIVTAALHERLDAPVVGRRTFGKGVVRPDLRPLERRRARPRRRQLLHAHGPQPERQGIRPDIRAVDDVDTKRDEASRGRCGPWTGRSSRPMSTAGATLATSGPPARVRIVAKRGGSPWWSRSSSAARGSRWTCASAATGRRPRAGARLRRSRRGGVEVVRSWGGRTSRATW